ncbi:uncharacterized protein LOC126907940 isoform X3 [Daktulosphaira vitifoliae]|uniref:uncharacterized protein LOC126907940 isoform X3 n=1 Tax=Daktulosphaira vitifoliae TaxID=58002 RepID=UPI0021AA976E|nr:uncharacterized protein LOC126907940 isoform X3 [Daktulosphaira vitifoliae]
MKFYSFILIFIVVFMLQPDKRVHCETYRAKYENYIERVVSHIYSQIISYRKHDSNNTIGIEQSLQQNTNMLNFNLKYCYTINILNLKYIEILEKFFNLIKLIINKCQKYHQKNELNNFIPCVQMVEIIIKNSKTMTENLHNAMKFLSYIDIRFLFSQGSVAHPIFDIIDFIYQYILNISSETSSFDLNKSPYEMKLENLIIFQADVSTLMFNFIHNSTFIDIFLLNYLKNIKIAELPNKFIPTINEIITNFFNEIIEVWYKNLGFEEFLNPQIAEFIPPIDPDTVQNDGIEALNIMRKESGWEKMNHISIVYIGKKFSVDQIINEEVTNINFRIKKEHVSQLLRCRFTEVMKNYRTLLSSMLSICNKDTSNYNNNCLVQLFSSFVKSKKMLKDFYEALVTLNKSSIWNVIYFSKSNLERVFVYVTNFLTLLENNDFSLKNIDDNKIEIVKQLLKIFKNNLTSFSSHLSSDMKIYDTLCHINDKFKNVHHYINYFKNMGNISTDLDPQFSIQIMLNACNFFDSFCENVSKSCYEDLGFEKLSHCKNKELDRKLL